MEEKTYYMLYVWGTSFPRKMHTSIEEAEKEAKRLSQKENAPVLIFKSISTVKCVPHFEITPC